MTLALAVEELIIDQCGRLYVWACLGRHGEDLRIVKMAELHQASPQRHQGLRGQVHISTDRQCGGMPGGLERLGQRWANRWLQREWDLSKICPDSEIL